MTDCSLLATIVTEFVTRPEPGRLALGQARVAASRPRPRRTTDGRRNPYGSQPRAIAVLHVPVLACDLPLDQGPDRPLRRPADPPRVPACRALRVRGDDGAAGRTIRSTSRAPTERSSRTSAGTSRSPRRPTSRGPCAGRLRRRDVHRGAARGRPARRRRLPLQGDNAQGQGLPAHAAARAATTARRTSTSSGPRSPPAPPHRRLRSLRDRRHWSVRALLVRVARERGKCPTEDEGR